MTKRAVTATEVRLEVFLEQGPGIANIPVGTLVWDHDLRVTAFQWSNEAIESGLNLSPIVMPNKPGTSYADPEPFFGIHPLFSDSIPDGFGLPLMNRGLAEAGHNLAEINALDRLAWTGKRGVGALTYNPEAEADVKPLVTTTLDTSSFAICAEDASFKSIPKQAILSGGSTLGARPKFWASVAPDKSKVVLGDSHNVEAGFVPSLLKFAPTGGDLNEPYVEAACLELAAKYGVIAAAAELLHYSGGAALAVHRFDRLPNGDRLHTQTVAALLGINFREPNLDYKNLVQIARKIGKDVDVERIYRQLCFNVALSMRDDHAKNFSFCMDFKGQWSLSPAYDLCPSVGLGRTGEHTTSVNGKGINISRGDLMCFAESIGLSSSLFQEAIDNARAAAAEFEALSISFGATKTRSKQWANAFKTIDAHLRPVMIPSAGLVRSPGKSN